MTSENSDVADAARAAPTDPERVVAGEVTSYDYRLSLLGGGWRFSLTPAGIDWSAGAREGFVPYGEVRGLRLSYRPTSMQGHRFVTEIWSRNAPALRVVSTTWKSMSSSRDRMRPIPASSASCTRASPRRAFRSTANADGRR